MFLFSRQTETSTNFSQSHQIQGTNSSEHLMGVNDPDLEGGMEDELVEQIA